MRLILDLAYQLTQPNPQGFCNAPESINIGDFLAVFNFT